MNSNYGKSNKSASANTFEFDLGLNSSRSRPTNTQNNQSSAFASTQSRPNTMPSSTLSWRPNKPSWTHQPAPTKSGVPGSGSGSLNGPTSMVGDIFGKSWDSKPSGTPAGIGIPNKNPNLFRDLLGSAMGQNKGSSNNVPLKTAVPVSGNGLNSMGGMADSLPKSGSTVKSNNGNWGSNGSYSSAYSSNSNANASNNTTNNKGTNIWGQPMRASGGSGSTGGIGMNSNKDPFGSLVDFGSKLAAAMNSSSTGNVSKTSSTDNMFGDFQNASKPTPSVRSDAFPASNNSSSMGSSVNSYSNIDDFGFPSSQSQPPAESPGVDAFDSLFTSSSSYVATDTKGAEGTGGEQFSGADDWGFATEFGGGHDDSGTTELEGLPPPPAGVTASLAKNKGMDNQKQGQYADAIKWLSWAVVLSENSDDDAGPMEVLSCRASCYKEVGEYKKAVADCTKVLEQDGENIAVLVQRALLYESMEKYMLGAEDLRAVMKLDPGNRVARSTIHRLTKMAE